LAEGGGDLSLARARAIRINYLRGQARESERTREPTWTARRTNGRRVPVHQSESRGREKFLFVLSGLLSSPPPPPPFFSPSNFLPSRECDGVERARTVSMGARSLSGDASQRSLRPWGTHLEAFQEDYKGREEEKERGVRGLGKDI